MDWPAGRHWLCLLTVAMSEEAERLKERTMRFALDVCHLIKHLPQSEPGPTIRRRWLEFIEGSRLIGSSELTRLVGESCELVAIFSASVGTARHNQRNR